MKLNMRCVSPQVFLEPGYALCSYETLIPGVPQDGKITSREHHLVLMQQDKMLCWLTLCPEDIHTLRLKNRYVCDDLPIPGLEEKMLTSAEYVAAEKGFNMIVVHACLLSMPLYEKLGYRKDGKVFTEGGNLHYKMVKNLREALVPSVA